MGLLPWLGDVVTLTIHVTFQHGRWRSIFIVVCHEFFSVAFHQLVLFLNIFWFGKRTFESRFSIVQDVTHKILKGNRFLNYI